MVDAAAKIASPKRRFCRPFDVCSVPHSLCHTPCASLRSTPHDTSPIVISAPAGHVAPTNQKPLPCLSSYCVTWCSTSTRYRYCTSVGVSAVSPTTGKPSRARAAKPRGAPASAPCINEGAPTADHIRLARPQSSPRFTHNVSVTIAPVQTMPGSIALPQQATRTVHLPTQHHAFVRMIYDSRVSSSSS